MRTNCCIKMQKVYQWERYKVLRGMRNYFVELDYMKKVAVEHLNMNRLFFFFSPPTCKGRTFQVEEMACANAQKYERASYVQEFINSFLSFGT